MNDRTRAPWLVYTLGALCAGAITAAILVVGPASSSRASVTRRATVAQGVVQSTVSGSGNLESASQLNLGFRTGGTVNAIYVRQGEHVVQGQLLATLDPQSAEVTLEQTKATLQSAEANLAKEEETDGEGATGQNAADTGTDGATASAADLSGQAPGARAIDAAYTPAPTESPTSTAPSSGTTTTTGAAPTNATTPATATTPKTGVGTQTTSTTTSPSSTTPATTREPASREGTGAASSSSSGSSKSSTLSAATREANLASARAAVKSDALSVQSSEQAVQDTKLYAPQSGTIVSLSGQVGEVVSGSGTTKGAGTSGSSGSGATGSGASAASSRAGAGTASSTSSTAGTGTGSSSSSSFAVLSDLSAMQLVVPLSETEITNVKVGQIATVTVEALEGRKLAAHVTEVALLSTSSSGAVSYDVTFQLDQLEAGLKLGMSATAEVVVKQAEGLNVPTSAISADSVTVVRNGKEVRQRVVTGLAGNTSTIILSGLKAGETVVLPTATTSTSRSSALGRSTGGTIGGGTIGGGTIGGGGFAAPTGGAFFRGGG